MAGRLVAATEVILPGTPLDVVAFGCTSASMVIGEERVFELIRERRARASPAPRRSPPRSPRSARWASRRIALLTPYRDDINRFMRDYIEAAASRCR